VSPRWTHLTLGVTDLDRSAEFYRAYCGLTLLRDRRPEGGNSIWLGPTPAPGALPTFVLVLARGAAPHPFDHLGFQCASREAVDRIADRAKKDGILLAAPKDYGGSVAYVVMVRDPDGHSVEFTADQPLAGLPDT
jgi:lactoylglutathione lyase